MPPKEDPQADATFRPKLETPGPAFDPDDDDAHLRERRDTNFGYENANSGATPPSAKPPQLDDPDALDDDDLRKEIDVPLDMAIIG